MKHTPQQLEEMLNAWEENQPSSFSVSKPSADVIQFRAVPLPEDKPAEVSQPDVSSPLHQTVESSAGPQSSNPITDFGAGDILPRPKVRKNARKRKVELERDGSGDISGFTVYDEEN